MSNVGFESITTLPFPSRSLSASTLSRTNGSISTPSSLSRRSQSFQLSTEPPNHTRRNTIRLSNMEPDSTQFWGYALLFTTYSLFVLSMYAIVYEADRYFSI
ncbi:hypothetical protein K7432_004274 [Basidiobolus ranarum]|uniref:Uncharacterized protein n=1 Tax=Basidiobolus ranarum TaxID=34480 RepID=A0ABR2W5E1_9FUNG